MALPVVLVTGCQKYRPYLEAAMKRFASPEWRTIGFIGDPTITEARIEDEILTLPVSDIYEALPAKVHAAFCWVAANCPGVPGVFKTDDDIVFATPSDLRVAIPQFKELPYWGLFVGRCRSGTVEKKRVDLRFEDKALAPTHQAATYCYGHGYWIRGDCIPLIVDAAEDYNSSFLEDVCTGFVMNRAGHVPARVNIRYGEAQRTQGLLDLKQ